VPNRLEISPYEDNDDLDSILTSLRSRIEEYKENGLFDAETERLTMEEIRTYEWLKENNITYVDFTENYTTSIVLFGADRFHFIFAGTFLALILISLLMVIISSFSVNYDFATGIYKQLYIVRDNRTAIMNRKLLVNLGFAIISSAIFAFVIGMVSLSFKGNIEHVLVVNADTAYSVSPSSVLGLLYFQLFDYTLMLTILCFSVCLVIKNIYASLAVNCGIVLVYILIPTMTEVGSIMTGSSFTYLSGTLKVWLLLIIRLVWWAITIVSLIMARRSFKRADL
jgi:hypothetical protein